MFNVIEELYLDPDPDIEELCQENKTGLKINPEKFNELINDASADPISYLDTVFDMDSMDMLRKGKMFELKKHIENNLNVLSNPFFMSRAPDNGTGQNAPVEMSIFSSKVDVEELLNFIPLIFPTGLGYQLEYLGHAYELMIRLEDAKKCYQLQYECTGEPELLDVIKKLDKKIKIQSNVNKIKSSVIDPVVLKNTIDETEEKLSQYVVALFSNDVNKIWKRLPWIEKQIQNIRKNEQESIISIEDKTDVERLTLGMFISILKESISKKKSNSNGKCEKCGKMWKENDYVFLATKSKESKLLICSNEVCFKDQGGLVSDASLSLLNYIYIIKDARNAYAHKRNYDQTMLQNVFRTAMSACNTVNEFIDNYLDKKNLI